jgi:alpha-1,3-mannosyltransferase
VQLVLGATFLFTNARAYLTRAFDFGRTFASEHSVTWRFLPEAWLASPLWSLLLLAAQLCALALCATRLWPRLAPVLQLRQPATAIASARSGALQAERHPLHPRGAFVCRCCRFLPPHVLVDGVIGIVLVMFSSNLVGVVCARSLHYQFLGTLLIILTSSRSVCSGRHSVVLSLATAAAASVRPGAATAAQVRESQLAWLQLK